MNKFNEDQMAVVRAKLKAAVQAPTHAEGEALVAEAANVLAGVVHRESKVIELPGPC